jgi:hypothetical protein
MLLAAYTQLLWPDGTLPNTSFFVVALHKFTNIWGPKAPFFAA